QQSDCFGKKFGFCSGDTATPTGLTPTPSGVGVPTSTPTPSGVVSKTPTPLPAGNYTMAQVAAHNSRSSCWTAINGAVYDVTSFFNAHSGGAGTIEMLCGIDGSALYNGQHGGARKPANELAGFKIGVLAN
ncbi:MAG: cytochrome b5 domain-containing protein, partial [Patescibacteria group bacterium]